MMIAKIYAELIISGYKKIDDVPENIRDQVSEMIYGDDSVAKENE